VPFENLSMHLDEPISLAALDLIDKIVYRARGGICYELNGAFALLLQSFDCQVSRVAARVYGDGQLSVPLDHMALIVRTTDGAGPWLVDVGFGSNSVYPLLYESRHDQDDPAGQFLLVDTDDGDVDVLRDGKPQYRIERRVRSQSDFGPTCWWQQSSPESHFTHSTICSRLTESGRITLSGDTLITTADGARNEERLPTDEAILAAYRDHFGLRLDRVPQVLFPAPPASSPPASSAAATPAASAAPSTPPAPATPGAQPAPAVRPTPTAQPAPSPQEFPRQPSSDQPAREAGPASPAAEPPGPASLVAHSTPPALPVRRSPSSSGWPARPSPPAPPVQATPPAQFGPGLPMRSSSPARHRAARTSSLSPAALLRQRNPSGRLSQPAQPSTAPPSNWSARPGSAAPWGPPPRPPSAESPGPAARNSPGPQDHQPPPLPRRVPGPPAPQFRGFPPRPELRSYQPPAPGVPDGAGQGTQTA
jgi:N-hydroxyarylamine O-acetyltransferase